MTVATPSSDTRPYVLLTDRAWPDAEIEREVLAAAGYRLVEASAPDEATLIEQGRGAVAIATNWAKVTQAVVAAAGQCRVIGRMGIGVDNIAVATATERAIPVVNCPDYCIEEVADHTLGLLLALTRKIGFFHHRTKQGEYNLQAGPAMHRLRGRILGLVGFGRTAQAVAVRAQALGLRVLATNRSGQSRDAQVKLVPLPELLAQSDYVSLHAPLTPETRKLISRETLAQMKPGASLINTSRGGLVDEAALWESLSRGHLGGAALDVFDPEPCDLTQPLFRDERVVVTPHAAFVSEESLAQMRRQVLEQIVAALAGERPKNLINPQIFENPHR